MSIFPNLSFLSYSTFLVPYAIGVAILSNRSEKNLVSRKLYWLNDFFMLLGWVLLSLFVVAGSIWGYEENWSGFWAWDPVEIASVVMWFVVTLYFHAKNHVPENHPLRSILAAMGWVAVTFSAFMIAV